jgi:acyl carrier protein
MLAGVLGTLRSSSALCAMLHCSILQGRRRPQALEVRILSGKLVARFLRLPCVVWKSLHEGQGRSRSRVSIATPARTRICRPAAATASIGEGASSVDVRVRRVVVDCLGIGADELSTGVSLTDDLAVDSLDLVDLAVALEAEFGIAVPDVALYETRTYGDLVDAIDTLMRARREVGAERDEWRVIGRSLAPPAREPGGVLARMSRLLKWDFQAPSSAKPRPA